MMQQDTALYLGPATVSRTLGKRALVRRPESPLEHWADLALAFAVAPWQAYAGAALWGLHMALTQGLLAALVADAAPAALRGTAFGVFNLMTGVAVLLASVIAGRRPIASAPCPMNFPCWSISNPRRTGTPPSRGLPTRRWRGFPASPRMNAAPTQSAPRTSLSERPP